MKIERREEGGKRFKCLCGVHDRIDIKLEEYRKEGGRTGDGRLLPRVLKRGS